MGIFNIDDMFIIELQLPDKSRLQFCKEMERSAKECNVSANRFTLRESGNRLYDDRLENGCGEILFARAVVDQGLNVRLRKDAAARRNGLQ